MYGEPGTAQGQLAFWDATAAKWVHTETSEMMWDDSNKRFGIGTTNPYKKLTVNANSDGEGIVIKRNSAVADTYADIGFTLTITDASPTTYLRAFRRNVFNDNDLLFHVGQRDAMIIKNSGNVGIGTTTPTAVLHLKAGTASYAPLKLTSGTLLTTPEAGAVEFLNNAWYGTITTGVERKQFAFTTDITAAVSIPTTQVAYGNATSDGLTSDANLTRTSGLLTLTDGSLLLTGTTGTTPASGAGTRLMWIPEKEAFRAGSVDDTQWDDANIGNNSFAVGRDSKASGRNSTSIGNGNISSGAASLSTGAITTASGNTSSSFGAGTKAESLESFVIGRYNIGGGTADSWVATDPLFEIGIGTVDEARANALTVLKNGQAYFYKSIHVDSSYYDSSGDPGTSGQILSSIGTGTNWIASSAVGQTVDTARIYDSLAVHLDTLEQHRIDINALFDTAAIHLDTLQQHRIDINAIDLTPLYDSIAVHLDTLQDLRTDINSIVISSPLKFSQTDTKTIINTTTSTNLFGSGVGSTTIPGNTLRVGDIIRVTMSGLWSNTTGTNATATVNIKLNTVSFVSGSPQFLDGSTDYSFEFNIDLVVRSIGSTGTVILGGNGLIEIRGSAFATVIPLTQSAAETINTTIDQIIYIYCAPSVASPNYSFSSITSSVEILKL